MTKKDGGPAFPLTGLITLNDQKIEAVHSYGMTLRDYFAAKAMAAEISRGYGNFENAAVWLVPRAYLWADAMLAERAERSK